MNAAPLGLTELALRDAHQSLLATRMRIEDMLPIAGKLDQVGFWSMESWGGATFDACIRYLGEDPWERLRKLKAAMPNTPQQMLLRGRTCSATGTMRTTWWTASWSAPRPMGWTCSASSMP